jgi:hypothetical protein
VSFPRTLLLLLLLTVAACKSASFEDAPDANVPCNAGAHVFCAADASAGCGTAGEPDKRIGQLPPGIYNTGCVANFVTGEKDTGGDCIVSSICRCSEPVDAGPDAAPGLPHWTCFP